MPVENDSKFKNNNLAVICSNANAYFLYAAPASNLYSTTFSILSYAKWVHDTPKLCVIDNHAMAQQFKNAMHSHHNYSIHAISLKNIAQSDCQILIFPRFSAAQEQHTLNTLLQFQPYLLV